METIAATTPGRALTAMPEGRFVRVEDLPGSRAAAHCAASRAVLAGQLIPVRRGLYYKGASTRYGMTRPAAEMIAREVLGEEGVGPTGYSAAREFGLTTQLPARPALTVAGPVPTAVHGVKISKRNNMRRRDLTYREIALLELLRGDWETTVDDGWAALATAVAAAVDQKEIRLPAIKDAVSGERSPAARENFDRLVRDLGERCGMLA